MKNFGSKLLQTFIREKASLLRKGFTSLLEMSCLSENWNDSLVDFISVMTE